MITIVSGLPRSGTSMMMRILEAGGMPVLVDHARVADVDNPNGYYEFEPVKTTCDDASWLRQAEGRAVKVVYKLLYDLPADRPYRVVFMQRALKEIVTSQNRMLARLGSCDSHSGFSRECGGPAPAGRDRAQSVAAGVPPADFPVSGEHALVETFATEVAAVKDWLRRQPNFEVLYVNYNQLVAGPRDPVARLNAFLGGHWDEAAMRRVVDPTLYRERS